MKYILEVDLNIFSEEKRQKWFLTLASCGVGASLQQQLHVFTGMNSVKGTKLFLISKETSFQEK